MTSSSSRPRVICHMAVSVDGRIVVDGWPSAVASAVRRQYEEVHASYESDGWICGRVTMEPFAGGVRPETDGDHVVAILSERVSDEYLAFLRARGVSYLLAGVGDVDLPLAMAKIGGRFGVKALMLEGGGRINGGMLAAGLIDEVSVLVAPAVDGRVGTPALFDVDSEGAAPRRLALEHVEQRPGGVLWLRYRVEPRSEAE